MPLMMGVEGYSGRKAGVSLAATAATVLVVACAGGPSPSSSVAVASETQWGALERPRVDRLADAPRVTVAEMILFEHAWARDGDVSASLGLQELISAGLLGGPTSTSSSADALRKRSSGDAWGSPDGETHRPSARRPERSSYSPEAGSRPETPPHSI